jgi:hypothetical protein
MSHEKRVAMAIFFAINLPWALFSSHGNVLCHDKKVCHGIFSCHPSAMGFVFQPWQCFMP